MSTSYRIRPKFEAREGVVKINSFTNPATHCPDSAVVLMVGANGFGFSHAETISRLQQCIDAIRENDQTAIPASQYMKASVPLNGDKGTVAVAIVAGTDAPSDSEITCYVGSAALLGISQYVDVAFGHAMSYMIEDAKAGNIFPPPI